MKFDFLYVLVTLKEILPLVYITLGITIVSMAFASSFGMFLAIVKKNRIPGLVYVVDLYVSFFRSIPTIVELFLIYYGLPEIFPAFSKMEALTATVLGLGLKNAAYLSEIFRAGLDSVDKGQMEACIGVGISPVYAYRKIILPQAILNALPATGNIFISLIKETSLAFTLGLVDMFAQAKLMASDTFRFFEAYLAAAIIFWILVVVFTHSLNRLEYSLAKYR